MMTSAQVVKTAVNVTTNSPSEDHTLTRTIKLYRLILFVLVDKVVLPSKSGHEILFCDYSVEG